MNSIETGKWGCEYRLEKREGDINSYETEKEKLRFLRETKPYEVIEGKGNVLLITGINEIWGIITGIFGTHLRLFDNAQAKIGVGDSNAAAVNTQTDLLGVNRTYKSQDVGFPSLGPLLVKFRSSFGAAEANYVWHEWVIKSVHTGVCLNRKQDNLGTKVGGTWILEVVLSLI